MRIFRGFASPARAAAAAVTIGNFDGVHRGHQAMLALLVSEAAHRGIAPTVLTFEPNPRDFFAARAGRPESAPARIATLRDKLAELERCGIEQVVLLRFDEALASLAATEFIARVLVGGLHARYVLVGDDFRFGARRAGDYALLDAEGARLGFDVARMMSYEVHGQRVSSSAVRAALAAGDMAAAAALLGRPYAVSGHVVRGAGLGRSLGESRRGAGDGFRTLNLRFPHPRPAASGIFVVRVHGLAAGPMGRPAVAPMGGPAVASLGGPAVEPLGGPAVAPLDGLAVAPLDGVASLGRRPTVDDSGRVLLETHVFDWPASLGREGGYGRLVRVELLARLRDEARYDTLAELARAIAGDTEAARAWLAGEAARAAHAAEGRQTTRDRI